jgi:hypothetical protein
MLLLSRNIVFGAVVVLAAVFASPVLDRVFARVAIGTILWSAGGVVAVLMFGAGIFMLRA